MIESQLHKLDWAASTRGSAQPLVVDVEGGDHLILMRMIPDDTFGNPDKANTALRWGPEIALGSDWQSFSFDTPMNALPGAFYHGAAGLRAAVMVLRFTADEWRVRVMVRERNGPPRILSEHRGSGEASLDLPVKLSNRPERFYLDLACRGTLDARTLAWAAPAPHPLPKLGISITTYNKEQFLRANIEEIRESSAFRAGLLDVAVINNGDELADLPGDITLIKKNNIGGTGGFLAGHRHFRQKGYAHFAIMDDDIAIPENFVDRLYALSCLVKGTHVGSLAEVLNSSERLVKEQGADVSRGNVFGLDMVNRDLDLTGYKRHKLYEYREVDYSGWWSLLVDLGAPCPDMPESMFIKRDDILFGYESRLAGTPTVVFPNLIVAHSEEGAATYFYYDIRNDLVLRARSNRALTMSMKQLAMTAFKLFVTYRLDRQRMFNAALADFMAGPTWLRTTPVRKTLDRVRSMAAPRIPIPEDSPELEERGEIPASRMLAAWFRRSAWAKPDPVPVAGETLRRESTQVGAYYEPLPYAEGGYLRTRTLASVWQLLRSLALLVRLAVTRSSLITAYLKDSGK